MTHNGPWGRSDDCQLTKVRRTSWLGVQVVSTSADLLQFQLTPSALVSIIGGVDLTGSKVVTHAIANNAPTKKCQFMFVIPFFQCVQIRVS